VLDFVVGEIQELPVTCQRALTIAAGIGARVDESILNLVISDGSSWDVLAPALEHGLLEYGGKERHYRFVHDRIQQAAYSLLPQQDRAAFHLEVGQQLWKGTIKRADLNNILFVLVGQMNLGISLIEDKPREQYELAALNLRAAKRAVSFSAFGAAAEYLHMGIALLKGKNHWRDQYELSLDLFNSAAEVDYSLANFEKTEHMIQQVLSNARTFPDQVRAYTGQVYLLGAQNKMEDAMDLGFITLKRLGESFPKKASTVNVFVDILRTKRMLRKKSNKDVLNLPLMQDPEKTAAMKLLNLMLTYAYLVNPGFFPLLTFRMIQLTMRHGICAISSIGFGVYGALLIGAMGEIKEGFRYGRLGLEVLDKFNADEWIPRMYSIYFSMVDHWTQPLSASLDPFVEGYRIGMETGDIEYGLMSANFYCTYAIHHGLPLSKVESELRYYCAQMETYKQEVLLILIIPTLQLVLNLRGQSDDPLIMTGEMMDQEAMLREAAETNNTTQICSIHNSRLFLACLFGDFEVAQDAVTKSWNVEEEMIALYDVIVYHTFAGLVAASLARRSKRRTHVSQLRKHLKKVARWAKHSPKNNLHKQWLLEAELAALLGDTTGASRLFRSSIEEARKSGFVQMQAIANERAGLFLRHCGDAAAAEPFYEQARWCYLEWGCTAKADRLLYTY
jgi:predicted ATPase